MRRDVLSAYVATASKILSWVIVLGLIYRYAGVAAFAMFSFVRGTIGILNYTALGLSSAMIRVLAEARHSAPPSEDEGPALATRAVYANGLVVALITGVLGVAITALYAALFGQIYSTPDALHSPAMTVVFGIGVGTTLRLMSDAPGSVLQAHGLIRRDNLFIAAGEAAWVLATVFLAPQFGLLNAATFSYVLSGMSLLTLRMNAASALTGVKLPQPRLVDPATLKRLLGFGSLVLFAQLADYLYAPSDYILIKLLLGWEHVAVYAPAMTIDSGLLLLVTGLSSVILPRTAIAHTSGEIERVRRYYIWGTAFSALLLLVAA
ncbi:MAG: rane protein EpsK, partial [Humisphaera sp.]|nr:rane protein EpsK [Humisphaera sp.]